MAAEEDDGEGADAATAEDGSAAGAYRAGSPTRDAVRGGMRRGAMRPLAAGLIGHLKPIYARFGPAAPLLAAWADIVGPETARLAAPVKLAFPRGRRDGGTLTVRVQGAAAIEIQHDQTAILAKVNAFLGYPAVAKLGIVQGGLAQTLPRLPARPPSATAARSPQLAEALARVDDPELRAALDRYARAMSGRR